MTLAQIGLLLSFSALLAVGQLLFKKAALGIAAATGGATNLADHLIAYATNAWFAAAILLYAGATFLWVEILKTTPLSLAYPFVAFGFVLVPLVGHVAFGEVLNLRYFLGAALILGGVYITTTSAS